MAGLYEMSPDGLPIVGMVPGVPNFVFANGASGHGVMHAPVLGELVAELVVDGVMTSFDSTALQPGRFARSASTVESEVLSI